MYLCCKCETNHAPLCGEGSKSSLTTASRARPACFLTTDNVETCSDSPHVSAAVKGALASQSHNRNMAVETQRNGRIRYLSRLHGCKTNRCTEKPAHYQLFGAAAAFPRTVPTRVGYLFVLLALSTPCMWLVCFHKSQRLFGVPRLVVLKVLTALITVMCVKRSAAQGPGKCSAIRIHESPDCVRHAGKFW